MDSESVLVQWVWLGEVAQFSLVEIIWTNSFNLLRKAFILFHMCVAELVSHVANDWTDFYLSCLCWKLVLHYIGSNSNGHLAVRLLIMSHYLNKQGWNGSFTHPHIYPDFHPKTDLKHKLKHNFVNCNNIMVQRKPETNKPQRNLQLLWRCIRVMRILIEKNGCHFVSDLQVHKSGDQEHFFIVK